LGVWALAAQGNDPAIKPAAISRTALCRTLDENGFVITSVIFEEIMRGVQSIEPRLRTLQK
jgi:hypothetical protein